MVTIGPLTTGIEEIKMNLKIKAAVVGATFSMVGLLGAATPASALTDGQWTYCNQNDDTICLFYNSNNAGSHTGIYGQVNNYGVNTLDCSSQGCAHYDFMSSGNGQLQALKNNAASAYNNDPNSVYLIYYNSNQQGSADLFDPQGEGTYYGNLNNTYNNNASQNCQCTV
jgi:hypothetical protein